MTAKVNGAAEVAWARHAFALHIKAAQASNLMRTVQLAINLVDP